MTREELREHCERQIQQFERVGKIMPVTPNGWKRYEEHKLVLELLEQEPKWIPVNDGPPKKFGTYIVALYDGHIYRTSFAKYQSKLKSWILTGRMAHWRVVAWQPLPQPYKAESESEE